MQDTTAEGENQNSVETGEDMQRTVHKNSKGGFIILDANDDEKLAGQLSAMEIDSFIPEELYEAVAQILAFIAGVDADEIQ